ncbi:MAG: hypothetical protein RLZZ511_358 [Cyanobacteriota bacterium]|jgi:hypothetical protein
MLKHFVLNLNPQAQFEWERCTLHHPITAGQPNLAQLIAAEIPEAHTHGSYLIAVNIEVTVLESATIEQSVNRSISRLELPVLTPTLAELAA